VSRRIGVIGVPTSAGAFAPGQEGAPQALREAGLLERLRDHGLEVQDHGDRERWRWRPDREDRHAQNLGKVVEIVGDTARRVADVAGSGELTLVLGGDCTVGIGTIAGHSGDGHRPSVIYFDAHADLNVPASVRPGTLDWMGMAHMLSEQGACTELVQAGPRAPLLEPDRVVLFGWDEVQSEPHERAAIERLGIEVIPAGDVAADPTAAATRALALLEMPGEDLLVHFDVDVIDFTDTPLSENWGRNEGISYVAAATALRTLLASPRLAGLTVTELNPDHVEAGSGSLERLARDVADGLAFGGSRIEPPRGD
jgi:arginase